MFDASFSKFSVREQAGFDFDDEQAEKTSNAKRSHLFPLFFAFILNRCRRETEAQHGESFDP